MSVATCGESLEEMAQRLLPHRVLIWRSASALTDDINQWCETNVQDYDASLEEGIGEELLLRRKWIGILNDAQNSDWGGTTLQFCFYFLNENDAFEFKMRWG